MTSKKQPLRLWIGAIPLWTGIVSGLVCFLLISLNFPALAGREDTGRRDSFSPTELAGIQEGDIILRKGVGTPSDVIATVLGEGLNISHCAVVVMPQPDRMARIPADRISFAREGGAVHAGRPAVIHTVNAGLSGVDGVQIQDLAHFNRYSTEHTLVVLRPEMAPEQRAVMIAAAWRHLAAAAPFDNAYDINDSTKLYCSELLFELFREARWNAEDARVFVMGVLGFGSFLDSRHYRIILSHNPEIHQ